MRRLSTAPFTESRVAINVVAACKHAAFSEVFSSLVTTRDLLVGPQPERRLILHGVVIQDQCCSTVYGQNVALNRGGLAALTRFYPGLGRMSRVSAQSGCRSADQKFRDRSAIDLDSETGAGRDLDPAGLLRYRFSQNRHPHRMLGLIELEEWSNRIEAGRVIRQGRDQLQRSRQGDAGSPHMRADAHP